MAARVLAKEHWKCSEHGCFKTADVMSWDDGKTEKDCPMCGGRMERVAGDRGITLDTPRKKR